MNKIIRVGGKLYMVCEHCGSFVRINKPILGSLHLCVEDAP